MDTCKRTTFNETNCDKPDDTQQGEVFGIPNLLSLPLGENDPDMIDLQCLETEADPNKPESDKQQQEIFQQTTLIQRVVVPRADFIKQNSCGKSAEIPIYPIQRYPLYEPTESTTQSTQENSVYKPVKQEKLLDTISYIFLDDENLDEIDHYTRESRTSSPQSRLQTKMPSRASTVGFSSKVGLASMMFAGGFAVGGVSCWSVISDQFASANTKQNKSVQKYASNISAYSTNALEKINISKPEIELPESSFTALEPSEENESQVTSQPAKKSSLNQTASPLSKSLPKKANPQLANNQANQNQTEPPLPQSQVLAATSKPLFQQRLLTSADLKGRNGKELTLMRNEIYARHGRRFKEQKLQSYFESQSWYQPRYALGEFPDSILSQIELKNAVMIREYQRIHGLMVDL
ncbi:YARHG domain-containing protein [Pelatocladus sp. BLCC-F211]|uniref:YARHG domain-containing protein n=1 Tax=Pelatocladus sp. BLCC-F211 TaxID=3342752 RepID=UPI0035B74411